MDKPLDPLELARDVMGLEKLLHVCNYLGSCGRYTESREVLYDRMIQFVHLPHDVYSYVHNDCRDELQFGIRYPRRFREAA